MNPRTTVILALVAGALGAFVYFYEIAGQPEREAVEREKRALFPGLEATEIDEIALQTPEGVDVVAERAAGAWRLREPLSFAADDLVWDGLADTLAALSSERVIESPQPLGDYGLGEDQAPLRFRAGESEYALRFGAEAPVGARVYATVLEPAAPEASVLLVASARAQSFARSLVDLREKRVLDFAPADVRRVEASWPGASVVLVRDAAETPFRMILPFESASDEKTLSDLLSKLAFLRAEGFVDDARDSLRDSFEGPGFEVELGLEGGGRQRLALAALDSGGRRLARVGESTDVLYLLRPELLEELPREVVDYRFKELVRFDPAAASEIEIVFADPSAASSETVRVVEQEEGWVGAPDAWRAGQAAAFVRMLAELDADDIAAESMGESELAALGLDPPWVTIRVLGDGDLLAELRLGQSDSERGVLAQVPGSETVYQLDPLVGARIPISFEAYRNRFVSLEEEAAAEGTPEEAPGAAAE